MRFSNLIEQVAEEVRGRLQGEGSGHDWLHIERVRRLALRLAATENARSDVVELAALLHDIADWKFSDGDDAAGGVEAARVLAMFGAESELVQDVVDIINTVSFKGAGVPTPMRSLEGQCVQDADRLDAVGAIGIARCFSYGGHMGRTLYDPDEIPEAHHSFEEYKRSTSSSLTHFHEKLYLLKDRMNTATGRQLAKQRHQFMQAFEAELLAEVDGIR
ncbi:MAG TPA: HD domain-containing protein [Rhodoferax sp.]